ncbi:hypothetical protein ACW9UR_00720 [Halovulum sp. GXIMD14794]
MSLVEILIILGSAAVGGVVAWAAWQVSLRRRKRAGAVPAKARKPSAVAEESGPEAPRPAHAPLRASFLARLAPAAQPVPPAAPAGPDPEVLARLDGLKADIATLAQAQLALLEGRAERESRLLAEMRAIAATPELTKGLGRVEAALAALEERIGAPETRAEAAEPRDEPRLRTRSFDDNTPSGERRVIADATAPREDGQRRDDSLVTMLDHARNAQRPQADTGLIGRRTLGPAE